MHQQVASMHQRVSPLLTGDPAWDADSLAAFLRRNLLDESMPKEAKAAPTVIHRPRSCNTLSILKAVSSNHLLMTKRVMRLLSTDVFVFCEAAWIHCTRVNPDAGMASDVSVTIVRAEPRFLMAEDRHIEWMCASPLDTSLVGLYYGTLNYTIPSPSLFPIQRS